MKVLLVNSYSNGSTGNIASDILFAVKESGNNECFFAYGDGPEVENGFRLSSASNMKKHAYFTMLTGLHGYCSNSETNKLINYIKSTNPDIINFHNIHGGYLNLQLLFGFLKNYSAKIVFTLHDCWLYTGKCYHYFEANCDKWKDKCTKCPQLDMYPKSLFLDRTSKMYSDKLTWMKGLLGKTYITTVSEWLFSESQKSFLNMFPIIRIYNGINTDLFKPTYDYAYLDSLYQFKGKKVILGVASSWNRHKGFEDFLLLSKYLHEDEIIVLVGINERQMNDLPKNIIGVKRTDNLIQLVSLYSRADVFLNCSTEETFGLVTGEAMSCGTPSIVYSSTGCGEVIDENTGIKVEPHNLVQVRSALDTILSWPNDVRVNCRNRIIEEFSRERMLKGYLQLYEDIYKQ